MGRATPDPPRTAKPDFQPPGQGGLLAQHVRCAYCATWCSGMRCDSCGAPVDWGQARTAHPVPPMARVRR